MKLSTAMRKGAALREQAYGDYIDDWYGPSGPCTCALGAAYEGATGLLPFDDPYAAIEFEDGDTEHDKRLQRLLKKLEAVTEEPGQSDIEVALQVFCKVKHDRDYVDLPDGRGRRGIFTAIATLNDELHWTREQIADYIQAQGY